MRKGMKPYFHVVQYYETDGMRIVHHSNYIRWFEEARVDYLNQAGMPYDRLEELGIMFPVLDVQCSYKAAVPYGVTVKIEMTVEWFDGLKFGVRYVVTSEDGAVVHATGSTSHCFLNRELRPIRVKRKYPEIYRRFTEHAEELRGAAARADRSDR